MARTKQAHYARVTSIGSLCQVPSKFGGRTLAIDLEDESGRRIFATFATSRGDNRSDYDTREARIRRMRGLAETLLKEANRLESDPGREV